MRSVEAEGGSIDEAIARALAALGVGRHDAAIDILENATRGLFGLWGTKARVRATLRQPLDAWIGDRAPDEAETDRTDLAPHAPARSDVEPAIESVDRPLRRPHDAQSFDPAGMLGDTLRLMGIDAAVASSDEVLAISGPSTAELIGRHGELLDALEDIVNRAAERGGKAARFTVDAGGYRARRRDALADLARRLAERARSRGKPVTVHSLSLGERQIVSRVLQDQPGVRARSVGQGSHRKLLIIPEAAVRRGGGKAAG